MDASRLRPRRRGHRGRRPVRFAGVVCRGEPAINAKKMKQKKYIFGSHRLLTRIQRHLQFSPAFFVDDSACAQRWFPTDDGSLALSGGSEESVSAGLSREECVFQCSTRGADGVTLSTDGKGR